jgi:hypothetical protein
MKALILIFGLLMVRCTKPSYVDVYSNDKAIWNYCQNGTDIYDRELYYKETIEMDLKCDSIRFFQIMCSRTGERELIIYKYKKK